MSLGDEQLLRYSRQIFLPEIDAAGQQRLLESRVFVVGLGGLGSPVSMYLASSGVGALAIADFDEVDLSNLQRQIVHTTADIGKAKTESAAARLRALNPDVVLVELDTRLDTEALTEQVRLADVVVDCTDNFESRFELNRLCQSQQTPLVSGAAVGFDGQLAVFDFARTATPCYQCLYPLEGADDEHCADTGVLAPLVGVIGSLQALETIKLLLGAGEVFSSRLLLFDSLGARWRTVAVPSDPACPICGAGE